MSIRPSRIEDSAFVTFVICYRPFSKMTLLAVVAIAAPGLPTPMARAQTAEVTQHAALSDGAKSDSAKLSVAQTAGASDVTPTDQANPSQQKSLTTKAIEKVKQVAKSASDIFSRVPCLPPKGGTKSMGSLPHVAGKLVSGEPVLLVVFGACAAQGYGSPSPEFTYPNRLAAQLRRKYPGADIPV